MRISTNFTPVILAVVAVPTCMAFNFRLADTSIKTGLSLIGNRRTQEVPLVSTEFSLPAPISQAPFLSKMAGVALAPPPPPTVGTSPTAGSTVSRILEPKLETKALTADSTGSDVLEHLIDTSSLAPFVGPEGVAVVTGGSSGIGKEVVEQLASTGMRVVLCARNPKQAQQVVRELSHPENVRVQAIDLADLNSVDMGVDEIMATEGKIDVLVNNAGIMSHSVDRQETAQKFELQLGVNHLAHFYLTRRLLPQMNQGGRIVTVSSTAYATIKKLSVQDLNMVQRYSPWKAYGQSKLANVMFATELQERLDAEGRSDIVSVAVHPGLTKTNLWRQHNQMLAGALADHMQTKTPEQGAATSVFASLNSRIKGGDFLMDCESTQAVGGVLAKDTNHELRRQLWTETENMILDAGFSFQKRRASE